MNHYETLGVPKDASLTEINQAWRRIASARHPDRSAQAADREEFERARAAYNILRDPKKREEYDLSGVTISMTDVDDQAGQLVANMFDQLLLSDNEPVDDLPFALGQAGGALVIEARQALHAAEVKHERVKRRRHLLRRREGHDVFAVLAQKALKDTYAAVLRARKKVAIAQSAQAILAAYERGELPPEQFQRVEFLTFRGIDVAMRHDMSGFEELQP